MENIDAEEFLKKLAELETDFKVYLPSLGKEVETSPLTLKQQKDIISTTGDARGSLQFTRTLNEAILKNVKVKELYPYDRVPIIIQLRKHALGDKVIADDYEFISLKDLIKNFKNKKVKFIKAKEATVDSLKLKLKIPTLKEETEIIDSCILELEKTDPEDISATVGTVYIFELIKYIESITIDDSVVAFNALKVQDRVNIIEKLPLQVYNQLVEFLRQMGKYETNILSVNDSYISITPTFFDSSTIL